MVDSFVQKLRDIELPGAALVLVTGAAGGAIATLIGAPLPWMLGALFAVAALALSGARPFRITPSYPIWTRNFFVPVIGLSIGSAFSPDVLVAAIDWWPSLLALLIYVPLAHIMGFWAATRLGGLDGPTAFYGTAPGGFIEAIMLGEEDGADPAMLAVLQFLRLALAIVLVPVGLSILQGAAVGSAAGVMIGSGTLSPGEWGLMAAAAVVGVVAGRAMNLPAAIITGPILLSGALHLLGWVTGAVPFWMVAIVQLIIGVTLGIRFLGRSADVLWTAGRVALVTAAAVLVLAGMITAVLTPLLGLRWEAVYLAFAPGGLAEMTLVAVSLETSVIFVSVHHVARIMLAVYVLRFLRRRMIGPPSSP
ncbi:MAG: AbrB family transcriptional regulator [Pseudomonadota bacterium]